MSIKKCRACEKVFPSGQIIFTEIFGAKTAVFGVCRKCYEALKGCGAIK
jgi:hypothetical protein